VLGFKNAQCCELFMVLSLCY